MKNFKLKMKSCFEIDLRITNYQLLMIVIGIFSLFSTRCSPLYAQTDDAQNILKKLSAKYETINDATFDFSQTIRIGVMKREQSFEGTLMMKRGKKYRIELEQQIVVTNGNIVWSYSKANQQTLIDSMRDDPKNFSPEKILLQVPENFNSIFLKTEKLDGKQMSVLKLTPKDVRSFIASMKIWFDATDSLMKKAEVIDVNDNFTQYVVKKISLNNNIDDAAFHFTIPEKSEVIDLR
ncbi:MAG: outer membrane lipoprotein carrier protein LolA [Ignavibacteria bacterium]|nr:outer membrane lipoprotein carrier protein LolA [Ignavibacteria bacterium]